MKYIALEIKARAKAVKTPVYKICDMAGVHNTTVSKWLAGVEANTGTVRKIEAVLDKLEADNE